MVNTIALAGGVAANIALLRQLMKERTLEEGM